MSGSKAKEIIGAEAAHKVAEKNIREVEKTFEPPEKSLFERNREALERAQKNGKV